MLKKLKSLEVTRIANACVCVPVRDNMQHRLVVVSLHGVILHIAKVDVIKDVKDIFSTSGPLTVVCLCKHLVTSSTSQGYTYSIFAKSCSMTA